MAARQGVLALVMVVAGCTWTGASPGPSQTSAPTASPSATLVASPSTHPSPSSGEVEPSFEPLDIPDGWLIVDGGDPLVATPGSLVWPTQNGPVADDTPWLVPDPGPTAGPGARCTVVFDDGTLIVEWSIIAAPADASDPIAEATELEAGSAAAGSAAVDFACPAAGDWVIQAFLRVGPFADIALYWRLTVG